MSFLDRLNKQAASFEDEYEYEESEFDDYQESQEVDEYEEAPVGQLHSVADAEISRIVTQWVASYADIRDFAEEFRSGTPVILNLSEADNADRARIVDFALGLCFGLEGAFSRVSEDVFLLTPNYVKLESQGKSNQHDFTR
ncbi:cell division protein SepF [Arcanobacterium hippocoleae]|uniref:Cell division protein SepF n=1 Tax=Arcanobacterium hippocoleae TaxID=149017 RepID=A0ABU1T0Y6_9ACTO|nr:cell division protein SepF [Arcanobacterium hippocoleae]MDR6938998.1 cell division inhibitor SepF [Arcanobacterium hippocoleae]